jgi:hypothetical protein
MKKNCGKNIQPLQVDPITGEYYVIIPEWIVNEFSWYEDTPIKFSVEGDDIFLSEEK